MCFQRTPLLSQHRCVGWGRGQLDIVGNQLRGQHQGQQKPPGSPTRKSAASFTVNLLVNHGEYGGINTVGGGGSRDIRPHWLRGEKASQEVNSHKYNYPNQQRPVLQLSVARPHNHILA